MNGQIESSDLNAIENHWNELDKHFRNYKYPKSAEFHQNCKTSGKKLNIDDLQQFTELVPYRYSAVLIAKDVTAKY